MKVQFTKKAYKEFQKINKVNSKQFDQLFNALKELENEDHDMKSYYGTSDKVVVKAVYAKDLGTFDVADYKFKREVKNSSYETIYTDEENFNKDLVFNFDGEVGEYQVKADKTLNAGTYRVY